jgi:hypothetical protein
MNGASAVTSIRERSTYSLIFFRFRFGLVPSTRNLLKFVHPSVTIVTIKGQKINVLRSRAASVQEILQVMQRDIRLGGHGFDSLKTNVR